MLAGCFSFLFFLTSGRREEFVSVSELKRRPTDSGNTNPSSLTLRACAPWWIDAIRSAGHGECNRSPDDSTILLLFFFLHKFREFEMAVT